MNRSTSESKFHLEAKEKGTLVRSAVRLVISPQQKLPTDREQREIQIKTKNRFMHWAAVPCYLTRSLPVFLQQQHLCCHPSAWGTCGWG